ncbi:valine--tRNA ligase [Brettanomyces nanus]|uniref:Valine--tRNA ligase, mitochondrial n=1 Tax=Eeniella nana TaxID=13502 RepID=A0A875S0W7_EENNA|nr:valine--tRNA ligase [Brettanomyces nanus]QPG73509.1 valine--tRNA ligase [Brettanomyces nanus]
MSNKVSSASSESAAGETQSAVNAGTVAASNAATINDSGLSPEEKAAKEAKKKAKEAKKAAKLAKFLAKKAKGDQFSMNQAKNNAAKKKKQDKKVEHPKFVDKTISGEKKIQVSLQDPSFSSYDPQAVESSWYDWWVEQGFFEPEFTKDGKVKPEGLFVIPAPPPNVTGALHIGHALTVSIQDTLIRWNRMLGKTVLYIPGFDHAGIATQSVVEKNIWAHERKTRHDFGREVFVEKVWQWKEKFHAKIKSQFQAMGASYDWNREAFTLDDPRSKAVTEAFVRLFDEGIIYRDLRLINWSVKLQTAISNLEVDNKTVSGHTMVSVPDYDEKVEFGVLTYFAYPVVGSDERLIVATTRPETIFGDTGVAVHPDDPRYKHLQGKFVQCPFSDRQIPIVTDSEAVDMEFGTGAVKITPGHDYNDYNTGKRNHLEFINILTDGGLLNENCGKYAGVKRFDARKIVIEELKKKGLLIRQEGHEMTLPFCSRSGDVVEPYLKPQWWVSQKDMAKEAIRAVKEKRISIQPLSSEHEYYHWLETIQDWCISRQLWWGHRCPAYFVHIKGEDNDRNDGKYWVAGHDLEEAQERADAKFAGIDFVLEQDEDVLDTWFSAGLWPLSTLGWPEKTKDLEIFHPMSMLETGWDILFFWVTRMILMGLKLTGDVPFKEVFCHSLVRDSQGRKMSKSLGNVIDPYDVIHGISLEDLHQQLYKGNLDSKEIEKAKEGQTISYPDGIPQCGTDALRFALCAYTTGGRDINLDILRVAGYRKFCNKIFQATKFVMMRLGDDYQPPATASLSGKESLVEQWILHKMNKCAEKLNVHLENREFYEATQSIYNFWLYELCDIYIENSKYLILEGTEEQKKSARDTLYTCIDSALRMIHPFMPFITEEMWQRLPKRSTETAVTIVKARYPQYRAEFDNAKGVAAYDLILDIIKSARSLLSQYNITKNAKIYIETEKADYNSIAEEQREAIGSLIKAVSEVTVVSSAADVPKGCVLDAASPDCNVHLMVKGAIDIDVEIGKVHKKLSKTEGALKNLTKVMNAEDYQVKASDEAKEKNRNTAATAKADIESYEATIANLEKLKL